MGESGPQRNRRDFCLAGFRPRTAKEEELEIPVQLKGKLIARLVVPAEATDDELKAAALANDRIQAKLDGRQIVKTIVVPKRLVDLVAK